LADAIILTGSGRSVETLGFPCRVGLLAVLSAAVVSVVQWPTVARCKLLAALGDAASFVPFLSEGLGATRPIFATPRTAGME
jgi:hypothetical protein